MSPEELTAAVETLDEETLRWLYRAMGSELDSVVDENVSVPEMLLFFLGTASVAGKAFPHQAQKGPRSVSRIELTRLRQHTHEECECGRTAEFGCIIEFDVSTELDLEQSNICGKCAAMETLAESDIDYIELQKRGELITQSALPT
jgi:hypothetical protein